MALLGNKLQQAYSATAKDTFNGDGSTVAFTLSRPSRTNDVEVFVENVQQEPTVAYAVSGTTLTFTEAPASGTGNIYVIHRTQATQSLTVNTDDITDGAITAAKIASGVIPEVPDEVVVSASAPSSPTEGLLWYDTTVNSLKSYDGTSWSYVGDQTATITDVDFLIVAGGGGNAQAGGGGGGYQYITGQTITRGTTYTVTVGAGGAGQSNGGDSSVSGLGFATSIGGGGGQNAGIGNDGGSGAGNKFTYTGAAGSGTSGQGNAGGSGGTGTPDWYSGGGGGAGGSGGTPAGGNGLACAILNTTTATAASVGEISGSNVYFSGGGGGGADTSPGNGGLGGATDGVINALVDNGTPNTGGGCGGRNNGTPYSSGGSGVVIIRLPTAEYSGTYTGSNVSVQVQGTDTLVIFKDSGSYTA